MENFKITEKEINDNNVKNAPDTVRADTGSGYTARDVKNIFDRLPELIIKKFNNFIDWLKTAMLTKEDLQEATNNALEQAKKSGEFDGLSVYYYNIDLDAGYHAIAKSDIDTFGRNIVAGDLVISRNGFLFKVNRTNATYANLTYCADLKGPEGSKGADGFSIYKATAEPFYNEEAENYGIIREKVETEGRTVQVSDFVLTPEGKMYSVISTMDSRTYMLDLFIELGNSGTGGSGGDGKDGLSVYTTTVEPYNEGPNLKRIAIADINTDGREVQVNDTIITPSGDIYNITNIVSDGTNVNLTYRTSIKGKDGLSTYKSSENAYYAESAGYYYIPRSQVNSLGRTVQIGEFILTPDGNLYEVTDLTDSRTYRMSLYMNIKGPKGDDYVLTAGDKEEIAEDAAAKAVADLEGKIPTKTSQLENDSNFAQKSDIPTSKSDVGLGNVANERQYSANNPPPYPVTSVNGVGGNVEVEPKGTAETKVTNHNADDEAHNDIRLLISALTQKVNDLLDSDDTTLDQMSEVVAYIKANRELLESYTTEKVNVADIIDNLTTSVSNKPLSAKQGVQLKALIDAIKVPTALSQLTGDSTHRTVTDSEKNIWNNKSDFSGKYADLKNKPTKVTDFENDAGYQTAQQVQTTVNNAVAELTDDGIPNYWQTHIDEKIADIKALQDKGGKDCFSFVVMADMHYPSNLGKNSPKLAKKILDKCDMRFALCLGDVQTRGCHETKELLLAENEAIEEMFSPIRNRLLQTEGNHDGSYGWLDRDGNGEYNNTDSEGNLKEPAQRETYVNNLTPAELHSWIYRKVGLVDDVHFDESGSGYYVDDVANKVRYIILNTHCNDYELQEDGTVKYPKMWIFRFTQPQFDLTIEALNTIPSDSWNVVVAGHCPLYQEIGDREIMQGVLNAFKNKTTYSGSYAGTASGIAYKNLAEPLPDNITDTSKWVNGYRFSSSGISAQSGKTLNNPITVIAGDTVYVKGVEFVSNTDRCQITGKNDAGTTFTTFAYVSSLPNADISAYEYIDGVHKFTIAETEKLQKSTDITIRFAFTTPTNPEDVIITVNEPIVEGSGGGYDAVDVNCDFTEAKGELTGYFAGHVHNDRVHSDYGFNIITTRCDAKEEHTDELQAERVKGTITEQSFDVFTVNKAERKIYATKIGAGSDRAITY